MSLLSCRSNDSAQRGQYRKGSSLVTVLRERIRSRTSASTSVSVSRAVGFVSQNVTHSASDENTGVSMLRERSAWATVTRSSA
jgi:hypothetical protein